MLTATVPWTQLATGAALQPLWSRFAEKDVEVNVSDRTPDEDRALYQTIILGDTKAVRDALYALETALKRVPTVEELRTSHIGLPNLRGTEAASGTQERLIDPIEVTKVTIDLSNGCRMDFWPRSGPPRGGVIPEHWAFVAGVTPPEGIEEDEDKE